MRLALAIAVYVNTLATSEQAELGDFFGNEEGFSILILHCTAGGCSQTTPGNMELVEISDIRFFKRGTGALLTVDVPSNVAHPDPARRAGPCRPLGRRAGDYDRREEKSRSTFGHSCFPGLNAARFLVREGFWVGKR